MPPLLTPGEAEERGEKEGTHEGSESAERRARRARREEEPRAESSFRVEADLLRSEIAELAEIVDQPPLPPGVGRRDRWSEGI